MKQTAVEWLIEKTFSDFGKSVKSQEIKMALQMEKLQTEISDEEIEEFAKNIIQPDDMIIFPNSFILGARWYREQIKKKQCTS